MIFSNLQIKWKPALVAPALALLTFATGCQIEREQAGEMPDVDVDVDPGQLPEYDVEGPDVEVGTEEKTITVPDVDVDTEQKEVTVLDIDVELPGGDGE